MVFCSVLFVLYTNPHFWTNLNQTLHISPPSPGRDRRECMVQKCLTFSTFLTFFVWSEYWILSTTWLPGARPFRHSVISVILAGVSVTSRCRRRHLPRVIRDSVISVIPAGVGVTSRKWRCIGRHLRVVTGSVVHYG